MPFQFNSFAVEKFIKLSKLLSIWTEMKRFNVIPFQIFSLLFSSSWKIDHIRFYRINKMHRAFNFSVSCYRTNYSVGQSLRCCFHFIFISLHTHTYSFVSVYSAFIRSFIRFARSKKNLMIKKEMIKNNNLSRLTLAFFVYLFSPTATLFSHWTYQRMNTEYYFCRRSIIALYHTKYDNERILNGLIVFLVSFKLVSKSISKSP